MKKFISILLALTLVLSLGVVAFADGTDPVTPPATPPSASEGKTFNFAKSYETTAGKTPAAFPAETLKFAVTAASGNPDGTMVTITDKTVAANPDDIVVTVPSYNTVGKWNYTVAEVAGNTQGVTYSDVTFGVQVLVTYNADGTGLVASTTFTTSDGNEGKIDEIVNKYDLGTLTVDKNVSGNLASKTEKFAIDVVFTSTKPVQSAIDGVTDWTLENGVYTSNTVTFNLAHGDSVATIANIPANVQYTVTEQAKHAENDANGSDATKGYTVTYTSNKGTIAADTTSAAVVLNTKGTTVDTGISVDSIPYIVLAVVSVIGLAVFFSKKRVIE